MKRFLAPGSLALLTALLAVLFTTGSALAHGHRQVGDYNLTVGFLEEPAYAGLKNGLDLTICDGHHCEYTVTDGQRVISNPLEGAEETLEATVTQGGSDPLPIEIEARFGQPGKYAAYFLPTVEGDYTFTITGTLAGAEINENFTSTKDGFSSVSQIENYPVVNESESQITALEDQVAAAQSSADTARMIGIGGIVAGVIGLLVAAFALARKPRVASLSGSKEDAAVESLRG